MFALNQHRESSHILGGLFMIPLGLSEETLEALDALERIEEEEHLPPDEGRDGFLEEQELRLDEMLSEGRQECFGPNDDTGFACGFREKIENGDEADLFALIPESEN